MEQIVRRDGKVFYGKETCRDADDAYCRFREDYHASVGREAFLRLNRLGSRSERIHGFGFSFSSAVPPFVQGARVSYRILGLVGISYCRIVGGWDIPCDTEDEFERWLDWALSRGSGVLRLVGKNDKSGRTSRRLNTKYR